MDQTMRCKDCVLKHLADAMSYAKEILAGHGLGGTPDHRPDYLGELVNAENHLAHMSADLLNRLMVIRTAAQMKRMTPSDSDIDALRELWIDVEGTDFDSEAFRETPVTQESLRKDTPLKTYDLPDFPGLSEQSSIGILTDHDWDAFPDRLDLFKRMAEKYFVNLDGFYAPDDLKDYGMEWIWAFPANVFVAKDTDALRPCAARKDDPDKADKIMRLVRAKAMYEAYLIRDHFEDSLPVLMTTLGFDDCPKNDAPESEVCVFVNRKPCCGMKDRLNRIPFVRVNDEGWPYMNQIWIDRLS